MNDEDVKQTGSPAGQANAGNVSAISSSGLGNKETEPVATPVGGEYLGQSTPEIEPPEEVKPWIKVTPERTPLTKKDQEAGMEHGPEATHVPKVPVVKLTPMDEEKLVKMEKGSVEDSGTWLARLRRVILKRLGIGELRLGG